MYSDIQPFLCNEYFNVDANWPSHKFDLLQFEIKYDPLNAPPYYLLDCLKILDHKDL